MEAGRLSERLLVAALVLTLSACGQQQADKMPPDLILFNAHVATMDAADSIAQAVAVSGNSITAVGAAAAGFSTVAPIAMLSALLLLSLSLTPWAASSALKMSVS